MKRLDELPPMIERDESMPLIEQVREVAGKLVASDDEPLDFYDAALALGCSHAKAVAIDEKLQERFQIAHRIQGLL